MPSNLLNKYVWLLDTIHRAGRISFEEIDRRWRSNYLSDGEPLSKRKFHKWRIAIEEIFSIIIDNENMGEYRYFISNDREIKQGGLRSWLISTISVSNILMSNQSIKERILLDDVPSGRQYLAPILESIRENKSIIISYQSFWHEEPDSFRVEPYCVKMFKQRWYLIANSSKYHKIRIYGLDRIKNIEKSEKSFVLPKDFSAETFFNGCYGIIANEETPVEKVVLRVRADQAKYLRSLPLHTSQCEISRNEECSIFEYSLRPTYDFMQEILSHGADVEVIAPQTFRKEIKECIRAMNRLYHPEI